MKGLEIVIARMQSNPEEFYDGATKWAWIGHREMQKALTGEEHEKLNAAIIEVRRHEFTHRAMQTLLPPEEKGYTVTAGGPFVHTTSSNLVFNHSGSTEAMRLDASGNLGIGLNNPHAALEIDGEKLDANTLRKLKGLL